MPLEELLARHCLVLAEQLKAAKKALEWYSGENRSDAWVVDDHGIRARNALAEIEKLGEQPDDD